MFGNVVRANTLNMGDVYVETHNNNRASILSKAYMIMFVLMPIFNQYQIGPLTYLQIFSLLGIILFSLSNSSLNCTSRLLVYIIYVMIISLIGYLYIGDNSIARIILRLSGFVVVAYNFYNVLPQFVEYGYMRKVYTIAIYAVVIMFFAQYLMFLITGKMTMFLIPNAVLNYNEGTNSTDLINYTIGRVGAGYYYRPASIFIEPVYFSLYCIPWLVIELFDNDSMKFKNYIIAIIVTIAMALTTSSMGMLCSLFIWLIYILGLLKNKSRKAFGTMLLILPVLVIVAVYLVGQSGVSTSIAIKYASLRNLSEGSSLTWRVLRGIECFKGIGLFQKIFGCGYGDCANYFTKIGLYTRYDTNLNMIDYMNGVSYMFCSIGIIGGVLMIRLILPYVTAKTDVKTKMLFACLIIVMFTSAIFDTDKYFLYLGMLIASSLSINDIKNKE